MGYLYVTPGRGYSVPFLNLYQEEVILFYIYIQLVCVKFKSILC